jgi:3-deoxy-D-manno-octulosonate 8-phosphate phosphatase (KDO 8-P phosphatase)
MDNIEGRAAKIRLFFLDIDGVMTDGRITVNSRGEETKSFYVKDGLGLKMLMSSGVDIVLITGRSSGAVEIRAQELGINELYKGVSEKGALCKQLMNARGLRKEETCCMGDDLPDLSMFREVGLRISVADGATEVRESADFITVNRGGCGAVREACEWILKCKGKWWDLVTQFRGK